MKCPYCWTFPFETGPQGLLAHVRKEHPRAPRGPGSKTDKALKQKLRERAPAVRRARRLIKWEHVEVDEEFDLGEYWTTEVKLSNGEKVARIYITHGFIMESDEKTGAPTTEVTGWAYEISFDERADAKNIIGSNFANRAGAEIFAFDALAQVLEECATRLRSLARSALHGK